MGEQMPYENGLLARRGELRPVRGDRGVEVEQAAVGEDVRAERDRPLGGGPDVDQGVPFPGSAASAVRPASPEIGHGPAVDHDGDGRADLVPLTEIRLERAAHRGEPLVAVAVNQRHDGLPRLGMPGRTRSRVNIPTGRTDGKA